MRIVLVLSLICSSVYLLITLLRNKHKYSAYIDAIQGDEYFLKGLLPFGLYILDKYSYSFDSVYDRKLLNYINELYGNEYSAYYLKLHYANKIVLLALMIIFEQITAILSYFNSTFAVYVLLIIGLLWLSGDNKLKRRVAQRRLEIKLEFPNFINKLTLLLNAGLTMSKAWEKISSDVNMSDCRESAFYSEVIKTAADIKMGRNETEAYSQFAKRVKTPEISRLMSTILQNTKRGGNDLVLALRLQANECWEMRKNTIKRLGEEASTKLLFPMMVMFFAIVIIVVTPAVLSMQGISTNF